MNDDRRVSLIIAAVLILVTFVGGLLFYLSTRPAVAEGPLDLQGRILLWHDWPEAEAAVLRELLTNYTQLHPGVDIITVPVASDEMVEQLAEQSAAGLGPDLLLTNANNIYQMATLDLLVDVAPVLSEDDMARFLPSALTTVSTEEQVYALPFAVHTQVLYYNRALVENPAETLPELLERVSGGEEMALSTQFLEAFWGVGAFNGSLFNAEGEITLGGGFISWLDFLRAAQTIPGFFIETERDELQEAFVSGEVGYYVGNSTELIELQLALGEDLLGVTQLPDGPGQAPASPVLQVEAFGFNHVAGSQELELALDLALMMTDEQQQSRLAREATGYTPASARVRINPSMPEATVATAQQSQNARAIPLALRPVWNDLAARSNDFLVGYRQVLTGRLSPAAFVERAQVALSDAYDLALVDPLRVPLCPEEAVPIDVWHSLGEDEAAVVAALAESFANECPGAAVSLSFYESEDIFEQFLGVVFEAGGPTALYASSRWLPQLAERELIEDIHERVSGNYLQQFIPTAVEEMRYQGRLYGIPESVEVLALYYDPTRVEGPPVNLEGLLASVDADQRLALPVGFFFGYWGMEPFGDFEYDAIAGELLADEGLRGWLSWLQSVQAAPGVDLYWELEQAEAAFIAGEAAYLVSGPWSLPRLRAELSDEFLAVAQLPSGPEGAARPILQVAGIMVNRQASESATATALAFARYLNLAESQRALLETGNHVTASVTMNLTDMPLLAAFRNQAKLAEPVVENENFARLEEAGDALYEAVLQTGIELEAAMTAFRERVAAINPAAVEEEVE